MIKRTTVISGQYTFSASEENGIVSLTEQLSDVLLIEITSRQLSFSFQNPYDSPLLVFRTQYNITTVNNYDQTAYDDNDVLIYRTSTNFVETTLKWKKWTNFILWFSSEEPWILLNDTNYTLTALNPSMDVTDPVYRLHILCKKILLSQLPRTV